MKPTTFIKRGMGLCLCVCMAQTLVFGQAKPRPSDFRELAVQGGVQGLGLTYSFPAEKNNNFQSVSIFIDYQGLLFGRASTPGGCLRYDYHFSLMNQGRMLLYAGPGAMAGYVTDRSQPYGLVMGLVGNLGFKYLFDRNITLGASLHPVVGYHVHRVDGQAKLNLYQSGLWRTILPEFSIGYRFGNQAISTDSDPKFRPVGEARSRRWTLGLECTYQPTIYNYIFAMYLAEDGSRYLSEINQFTYLNNAAIRISAAWHFTDYYQLRLLLGYAGLRPNVRVGELLLRNQWNFKPVNTQGDGFFAAVDAGCALKPGDWAKPYALLNVSFGYSLAVSADSRLEFFIRSANSYGTPTLYEDGIPIPQDRAYQSQQFVSNIALGIALEL